MGGSLHLSLGGFCEEEFINVWEAVGDKGVNTGKCLFGNEQLCIPSRV